METLPDADRNVIASVEKFVAQEFEKHPHYSFNDWHVMYEHSLKVRDMALKIAEGMTVDRTVLAIAALLHDIGKTYETDAATLHTDSATFNVSVSRPLLDSLPLSGDQRKRIEVLLQNMSDTDEMRIIEDADDIAFFSDKQLYMHFLEWAKANALETAIQRKIDKFAKLHFQVSREIGREWFDAMKKDWGVDV